ncbi:acyl-CoA dehydrogenase family protein [Acinetobacter ihumii]|uniref:acyl-CoA dehydrogenase family protein n=1 Tax=Acinetobacter ihumii TaxID=2483802 RepID=UPI00102F6ABB|nr:acyl-CoA dehydrogenase family protein [Acinetobacter ihumii]
MTLQLVLSKFEQQLMVNEQPIELNAVLHELVAFTSEIPLPAHGQTYKRWQILAQIAATHLGLAKCFESHLDAISILKELNYSPIPDGLYAVWAAEGPECTLSYEQGYCHGQKTWCSAAKEVDYALMTYRDQDNQSQLVLTNMSNPAIHIDLTGWHAVGMHSTQTAKVEFQHVAAEPVGKAGDYLNRAGFWHGAAGVAACWYGAATRLADILLASSQIRSSSFQSYYLGQITTQLITTRSLFQKVANQIDRHPGHPHELMIRVLRAKVEETAQTVLTLTGQALGARPFCENAIFSQLAADLPVFLRQSHAAFDFEKIAELTRQEQKLWHL